MKHLLGTGKLTWAKSERVGDRYGAVYLLAYGDSMSESKEVPLTIPADLKPGKLVAHVKETRKSTHVGDWAHGISPTTPEVGETIELGSGKFFQCKYSSGTVAVGAMPDELRTTLWMDINALYRAHEQTVDLYWEEA